MQRMAWIYLVLALAALLAITGCSDGGSETFTTIDGTIVRLGVLQDGATVSLWRDGQQIGLSQTTGSTGTFSFPNVPPGTYVIRVVNSVVSTYYGPFTVGSQPLSLTIDAPSPGTLPTGTVPTNDTATAMAVAYTANGTQITTNTVRMVIDNSTSGLDAEPDIPNIMPSRYTVFITDTATGDVAIIRNAIFFANSVVFFRAFVSTPPPPATVTGTLTDGGTTLADFPITMFRGGVLTINATTDTNGNFGFPDLDPGTYYLRAVSGNDYVFYGPINVGATPLAPIDFDIDYGPPVPVGDGTTTLIVTAFEDGQPVTNQLQVTVNDRVETNTPPVLIGDVPAGTNNSIRVRDTVTGKEAVFMSFSFVADSVTVIRAVLG